MSDTSETPSLTAAERQQVADAVVAEVWGWLSDVDPSWSPSDELVTALGFRVADVVTALLATDRAAIDAWLNDGSSHGWRCRVANACDGEFGVVRYVAASLRAALERPQSPERVGFVTGRSPGHCNLDAVAGEDDGR